MARDHTLAGLNCAETSVTYNDGSNVEGHQRATDWGQTVERHPWGDLRMIRSELLAALAKANPELRADDVERVVDVFFDEVAQRLADGGRVELRGFGAFSTREREPRKGRNPRTGESVEVPGKRVPFFKPGKEMRARLNV